MTTQSQRNDRWDLVARRIYGRLDDDTLGTLARANRDLPFAFDEGLTLRTPPVEQIRAGSMFQPTDLSEFPLGEALESDTAADPEDATVMSLRSDRWDLVARRVYGRLDDDTLGTLARANRALPFAFDDGLTLATPPVAQLRAGGTCGSPPTSASSRSTPMSTDRTATMTPTTSTPTTSWCNGNGNSTS